MSNTEELIQDLTYLDPLGKSDHIYLTFTVDVVPEISKTSQIKYKMDKGDYEKMRNLFGAINWETELDGKSMEQARIYFHDVYTQVTNECIPKCQVRPTRWRRPLWMTSAAVKLKQNTGHGKNTNAPEVMKIMRSMLEREMLHKI